MVSSEREGPPRRSVILLPMVVSLWLGGSAAEGQALQVTPDEHQRFEDLVEQRRQLDETVWANEQLAQRYEATFVALWDDLLFRPDKHATLAGFPFQTLRLGALQGHTAAGSGVTIMDFGAAGRSLDPEQWKAFIEKMRGQGYRIEQTEWHHSRFEPGGTEPPRSEVRFVIHASHFDGPTRYEIEGTLKVRWSSETDERGNPVADAIDATDLLIKQRCGDPPFTEMFRATVDALDAQADVLVFDLDNDGRSEIAYPAENLVFWNSGGGSFQQDELCAFPAKIVYEAAFADFTGDGQVDLLCAGSNAIRRRPDMRFTLFLYAGDGRGRFAEVPTRVVPAEITFVVPETMALGDIDADGDLDVWLGQYRAPYGRGQFPKPYYDANDGLPAYLLRNAGDGHFVDATVESGLATKRFRRIFRSSFVDLDDDGDLDLLVVSDFAGIDVYFNDGHGRFQDVTDRVVDEWMNFGMSHTFSDFNTDGRLDLYVTGMASTTARRLHQMGLGPSDQPDYQAARVRIGYGNRLYLGSGPGRFEQPSWGHLVARSGWTWACTTLDIENDGDPDIYVTNGNISGKSTKDYCTRFWCHDIYTGTTGEDAAVALLFRFDGEDIDRKAISWNGYEHNFLYMNQSGRSFLNTAFLMGVALERDSNIAVADDFDTDGRADLLVTWIDRDRVPNRRVIQVFRNGWADAGNWIGLRLRGGPAVSPLGAKVLVSYPGGKQADVFLTGDSAKSQHAHLKHFGLGRVDRVDAVVVRWPNGKVTRLEDPEINRYHDLGPLQ